MSGDNPRPNPPRVNLGPLPELDLDENEAASLRPAIMANARAQGVHQQPPPPPPAPNRHLPIEAQPDIQLDMASSVVVTTKYRPAVRGVTCGTAPEPHAKAVAEDREKAEKIANYGPVPKEIWRYGLYAYAVIRRQRELKESVAAVQKQAEQANAAYANAVIALGERVKATQKATNNNQARDRASVGEMRTAAAPAGQKLDANAGSAEAAERGLIENAFRVLDDTRTFGREWDPARKEIAHLIEAAETRQRVARQHEIALASADKRAVLIGAISYVGGAILVLLLIFSPVLMRMISPPELPPLPPEPTPAAKPAH